MKMFSRFVKPFLTKVFTPKKIITTAAILGYSFWKSQKMLLDSIVVQQDSSQFEEVVTEMEDIQQYMKILKTVDVCQGKELLEGEKKTVVVKDFAGKDKKIIVIRTKGNLYAISGICPHKQPFQSDENQSSLEDTIVFEDKLFCPHHGCVFDIKSGSVQHGPSLFNLPIFMAEQKEGIVKLTYPQAIPTSVAPSLLDRDQEDLRKVVIMGGDDAATIGCVNGLRQFGFQGEISVVKEGKVQLPYKKEYLHKSIINLHLDDPEVKEKLARQQKQKNANKPKLYSIDEVSYVDKYISNQLQERIYKKLQYYRKQWYDYYGVNFIFNDQSYRIINKQYYPYVTFGDGTKLEFDALLIATGVVQKIPTYDSITVNSQKDFHLNLADNVFCPLRSKEQHQKMLTFLNKNKVEKLLVLGYNLESLQFVEALNKQFPNIKVQVIDTQKDSPVGQHFGPELQKAIAKEYTQRGVQFYIKIEEDLIFSNRQSYNNRKKKKIANQNTKKLIKYIPTNYKDSVQVRIADDLRLKADGVVIFPNKHAGNTAWVKNGKYTDFDFVNEDRISGDTFGRTDNIRVFAAGTGSANQYFLLNRRLVSNNSTVSLEQGYNVALNMQALRIPFSYVPFQVHNFFDKKLLYVGTKEFFDSVLLIGSIEKWDFIAIYSLGSKVRGVSASPSRAKQINIMREAFRINCVPMFEDLVSGYWSIQNLYKLVRELKRSGCYRDIIFKNRDNIHKKDLIWMERSPDAGFENDRPVLSEEYPSVQVGDGGVIKEL